MMVVAELVICNKCGIEKEATQANFAFRVDAQCLRRTCRDCQRERRKVRFNKDKYGDDAYYRNLRRERLRARRVRREKPEINRKATARWRAKNPDKCRELARAYRVRRGAQYAKEWRARNREWFNVYMRDWRRRDALKTKDPEGLLSLIVSALPKGWTGEVRDEVVQELLVKVLAGEVRVSQIKQAIKPLVGKFYRDYANRSLLSLDAPVCGFNNLTLGELIEG